MAQQELDVGKLLGDIVYAWCHKYEEDADDADV